MKGSDWIKMLPKCMNTKEARWEYERLVLEAVLADLILPIVWCPIQSEIGLTRVITWVSDDVLRVGEPDDYVRVMMTARTQQLVADILDARIITSKICDMIWLQADHRIEPCTQPAAVEAGTMDCADVMAKASRDIDAAIAGRSGLIADIGKHWVLSKALASHPGMATNYGWHTEHSRPDPEHPENGPYWCAATGGYMWQTLGMRHNTGSADGDPGHLDYGQLDRLWCRVTEVDDQRVPTDDVLASSELAPAVSYDGRISPRYPGVPRQPPDAALADPPLAG